MKHLVLLLFIVTISLIALSSHMRVALAANQAEDAMPQSGDLCGGTGGIGRIISVGDKEFTIQRNDDGRNQIIHLTNQVIIKTSSGSISLSQLQTGERVTLVGGSNQDGSFTADTVVVCSATQTNHITPLTIRKRNTEYKNVSSVIDLLTIVLFGLIWLSIVAFLRLKKKRSFVYLLFFTIFYIYLYKVLDYTLWQFQSLFLLKHFVPDLMLNGLRVGKSVNLIPLVTLRLEDVRTSFLNMLLMMPFGFGLPFVTNFRMKKIVTLGLLLSITIEFLQLVTGLVAHMTFRVADVNDVLFNTLGVAIGYMLFVEFIRNCRQIFRNWKISSNPILHYIADRPQVDK